MNDMTASHKALGAEIAVRSAPYFPRKKKVITGRSIAVLVFLSIGALFFCVPLYVVIVT